MWQRLLNQMSIIDMFGQPVSLQLGHNQFFKTFCGGVVTSAMAFGFIVFTLIEFINFLGFTQINVVSYQRFDAQPLHLQLPTDEFMFAVSIEQSGTAYNQNPYFTIQMKTSNYTLYPNGTRVQVTQIADLEPCTLEHWNLGGTFNWTRTFYSLQLYQWLCPKLGSNINLAGAYDSSSFEFIRFNVIQCDPNVYNNCASDAQRESYLQANGAFRFQFYVSNYIVNPDNFDAYDTYLLSTLQYQFVPNNTYKEVNVFMQQYEINTDTSLTPVSNIQQKNLPVLDQREVQETTYTSQASNDLWAVIYLRRSYFSQVYDRQFQKIFDLISYIGGFIQAFMIAVGVFVAIYNQKKMMVFLANKLYDFEIDDEQAKEEKKQEDEQKKQLQAAQNQKPLSSKLIAEGSKTQQQNAPSDSEFIAKQSESQLPQKAHEVRNLIKLRHKTIVHEQPGVVSSPLRNKLNILSTFGKLQEQDNQIQNQKNSDQTPITALENKQQTAVVVDKTKDTLIPQRHSIAWQNSSITGSINQQVQGQSGADVIQKLVADNEVLCDGLKFRDRKTFLQHQFEHIILREKCRLQLSFKYFIFLLTCGKFMRTPRNLMIDKSIEKVETQLDVYNVLEKLQQVDKLKKLLLRKDQRVLFNFFPKEVLRASEESTVLDREQLREMFRESQKKLALEKKNSDRKKKLKKEGKVSPLHAPEGKKQDQAEIFNNNVKLAKNVSKFKSKLMNVVQQRRAEVSKKKHNIQFFTELYDAYENVMHKAKPLEKQLEKDQLVIPHLQQQSAIGISNYGFPSMKKLQTLINVTMQRDINERLIWLMGKEMYDIIQTSQLLKFKQNPDEVLQQQDILSEMSLQKNANGQTGNQGPQLALNYQPEFVQKDSIFKIASQNQKREHFQQLEHPAANLIVQHLNRIKTFNIRESGQAEERSENGISAPPSPNSQDLSSSIRLKEYRQAEEIQINKTYNINDDLDSQSEDSQECDKQQIGSEDVQIDVLKLQANKAITRKTDNGCEYFTATKK